MWRWRSPHGGGVKRRTRSAAPESHGSGCIAMAAGSKQLSYATIISHRPVSSAGGMGRWECIRFVSPPAAGRPPGPSASMAAVEGAIWQGVVACSGGKWCLLAHWIERRVSEARTCSARPREAGADTEGAMRDWTPGVKPGSSSGSSCLVSASREARQ